jgi:AraC family transcriptional activator of pobA
MLDGYNSDTVICGNLTEAVRYQCASLRLCGCNGFHTALWLARGKARIMVDGQTIHISGETGVIIDADTPKHIEVSGTSFGSVIALRASEDFEMPAPVLVARVPNIGEQQKLAGFMDYVVTEGTRPAFGANAAQYHLAHYYFVHLARLAKTVVSKPSAAQRLMARFVRLLEQDFTTGKSLSDYAATLNVTTTHLTRVCQQLNEKSAMQLIQDRVLAEAKLLLATTQRPVVDISESLGFASPAYFTRLFSQKTGLAPTDFRRSNRPIQRSASPARAAAE